MTGSPPDARARAGAFCARYGLRVPVIGAPMAGACPAGLAVAVADAGGMGGLGALTLAPAGIADWAHAFRSRSNGAFQINLWVPDPAPARDPASETRVREFLGTWGPAVPDTAGDAAPRISTRSSQPCWPFGLRSSHPSWACSPHRSLTP